MNADDPLRTIHNIARKIEAEEQQALSNAPYVAGIPRKADNGKELPLFDRVIQLSGQCQGHKEIAALYRSLVEME